MCRWIAYSGAPIYLEDLIFHTEHSLIDQSLAARLGTSPTNGDGFGIGWYDDRDAPGLYRDTHPAWNDANLRSLTAHIRSPLFLAHVRATTGTAVQRSNCHPFAHDRWLFMHNGLVRGFSSLRRALALAVDPALFSEITGTTDTEIMFFLALSFGLQDDPLPALERMAGFIEATGRARGVTEPLMMTLGVSDGRRLYTVRYSSERDSRTLYYTRDAVTLSRAYPEVSRFSDDAVAVVSEPFDALKRWTPIPESHALVVEGGAIELRPFTPRA
ncbi:MAG: class II glutamine amidotransferase [Myxococcales bacterium]|nr:class II glutamine amidotransferase [Myxococcales bacterium]